jgi:ATP-dependent DNA helicase HFM1/MER3
MNSLRNGTAKPNDTTKNDIDFSSDPKPKDIMARTESSRKGTTKPSGPAQNNGPEKLENGRWACNHKCKDKSTCVPQSFEPSLKPTNYRRCKHFCCREGLDNPPKAGKKKSDAFAMETAGSNQLTLSGSITKRASQPAKQDKKSKRSNRIGSFDDSSELPLPALTVYDIPALSSIVDSSDYGYENFDDLPLPEDFLFGKASTRQETSSGKGLGTVEADEGVLEPGDNWVDGNDIPFAVQSPQIQSPPRETNCGIVDLVTPEPQEMGPMAEASENCAGTKRNSAEADVGEVCSEENKRPKTMETSEPQINKDSEAEPQLTVDKSSIPQDWDDIDRAIMEEYRDCVVFI